MKPIEPGCKCLAFQHDLEGSQECIAVEFFPAGSVIEFYGVIKRTKLDVWKVDRKLNYKLPIPPYEYAAAPFMIRIDDDTQTQRTKVREIEHA